MVNRTPYTSASAGPITGPAYMDLTGSQITNLYDHSALKLTSVGGTANAITASLDPALPGTGLSDGMKFTFTAGTTNTGGVTLAINGGSAVPVLDASGAALTAGDLTAGMRVLIEYVSGNYRILSGAGSSGSSGTTFYYQVFTASGTWTKPADIDPNRLIWVEMWGGGGSGRRDGGASGGGGSGGSYIRAAFRAGDLPASVAVTVGSGGAAQTSNGNGAAGGASSFGALLSAPGGPGGTGIAGTPAAIGTVGTTPAHFGFTEQGAPGGAPGAVGGSVTYAGAGGGGGQASAVSGGTSLFGGDGGDGGDPNPLPTAGSVPGGGGGGGYGANSGAGARGEVRIFA